MCKDSGFCGMVRQELRYKAAIAAVVSDCRFTVHADCVLQYSTSGLNYLIQR